MDAQTLQDETDTLNERLRQICEQRVTLKSDYTKLVSDQSGHNEETAKPSPKYVKKKYFDDLSSLIYKKGDMSLLTIMHPGNLPFADLIRGMSPIIVEGLEHLEGIYGETAERINQRLNGKRNLNLNSEPKKQTRNRGYCDSVNSGNRIDKNTGSNYDTDGEHSKMEVNSDKEIDNERPPHNSHVWIHFAMYAEGSTTPFDSTVRADSKNAAKYSRKSIKVRANCDSVIPGLAIAIRWLPVGSRGRFVIPSKYMFGPTGYRQLGIEPNASILLLLHTISCLDADAINRYNKLDIDSKGDFSVVSPLVASVNALGKDFFYRKIAVKSIKMYIQSLEMLTACRKTRENFEEYGALFNKTTVNLALCYQLTERPLNALTVLDSVDVDNCEPELECKLLFIKSKCLFMLGDLEESMRLVRRCHAMRPSNIEIGALHSAVHGAIYSNGSTGMREKNNKFSDSDVIFSKTCEATKSAFIDVVNTIKVDGFQISLAGGVSVDDYRLLEAVMAEVDGWTFDVMGEKVFFRKR